VVLVLARSRRPPASARRSPRWRWPSRLWLAGVVVLSWASASPCRDRLPDRDGPIADNRAVRPRNAKLVWPRGRPTSPAALTVWVIEPLVTAARGPATDRPESVAANRRRPAGGQDDHPGAESSHPAPAGCAARPALGWIADWALIRWLPCSRRPAATRPRGRRPGPPKPPKAAESGRALTIDRVGDRDALVAVTCLPTSRPCPVRTRHIADGLSRSRSPPLPR